MLVESRKSAKLCEKDGSTLLPREKKHALVNHNSDIEWQKYAIGIIDKS